MTGQETAGETPVTGASSAVVGPESRKLWVIHPVLFAAFPAVAIYAQNIYESRPSDLEWPIGLSLAGALVVWLVVRILVRDSYRAGALASLLVGTFFSVNHASDVLDSILTFLSKVWVPTLVQTRFYWGMGLELAIVLAVAVWVLTWGRKISLRTPTKFLNVFAMILLAMPTGSILMTKRRESRSPFPLAPDLPLAVAGRPKADKRPDIYYIILDGFARGDVQKEIFGHDLEPFLTGLESRGFRVPRHSTANYCQTPLCLSSSLNSHYLNDLIPPKTHDTSEIGTLIGNGAVVRALHSQGYKFVTYATGFEQTEHPSADVYRTPYPYLRMFHRLMIGETPIVHFLSNPVERDQYTMTRERTTYLFDSLPEIARDQSPTFTFAHILVPHPPFVFGANGEDVSPRDRHYVLSDGTVYKACYPTIDYIPGYRGSVAYVTRQVEQVVDRILAASPEPPVIIVQSDHGSGLRLDIASLEASDLHERMSILNAYYLPGEAGKKAEIYDTITPVNSFRVVFNTYLGADLPLLPDRNYFSTWDNPFTFIDVTGPVKAMQDRGSKSVSREPEAVTRPDSEE